MVVSCPGRAERPVTHDMNLICSCFRLDRSEIDLVHVPCTFFQENKPEAFSRFRGGGGFECFEEQERKKSKIEERFGGRWTGTRGRAVCGCERNVRASCKTVDPHKIGRFRHSNQSKPRCTRLAHRDMPHLRKRHQHEKQSQRRWISATHENPQRDIDFALAISPEIQTFNCLKRVLLSVTGSPTRLSCPFAFATEPFPRTPGLNVTININTRASILFLILHFS